MAAYARQSRHFPRPVADLGIELCDVGDRPQEYGTSYAGGIAKIMWIVVRSWFMGLGKSKTS